ncbi:MAG: flavin reductase family protein [Gammaproteobacteria bacterium]|nr:flavin reductase family protein [Gammaproteobacteria bacterium]
MTPLDQQAKLAFRHFAHSVHIVTAVKNNGARHAMTATSITSLSMTPPSLLICVNRQGGLHQAIEESGQFCVNTLNPTQQSLADDCAWGAEGEARFQQGEWLMRHDLPFLQHAQTNIFCKAESSLCYASHSIFIGRIIEIVIAPQLDPLMYLDGTYFVR